MKALPKILLARNTVTALSFAEPAKANLIANPGFETRVSPAGISRDCDHMRVPNFKRVRGLDAERELLHRPTEQSLPNLTPIWANGNLGADSPHSIATGILSLLVRLAKVVRVVASLQNQVI